MAHIGIRPQSISKIGQLRAEATTADMATELIALSEQMVGAGANSLLIEGTAAEVAEIITKRCEVPVIGCGSGPGCDGQVLVLHDLLGLGDLDPKFVKRYGDFASQAREALTAYRDEVRAGTFPAPEHCFIIADEEFGKL